MHVFLTGDVQIGKSTAIRRAIAQLGRPVYGFRTFFTDRESAEKSLYMLPAAAERAPGQEDAVAVFSGGRPTPLTARFDALGASLLRAAQAHPEGLILMDECGRFEREAYAFQREIARCLDGDIPVLGGAPGRAGLDGADPQPSARDPSDCNGREPRRDAANHRGADCERRFPCLI